jgi:hypothetical protein
MIIVLKRFRKVRKIGSEENIELFMFILEFKIKLLEILKKSKLDII